MKVDSVITVPVDPLKMGMPGSASAATAQAPLKETRVATQSQNPLQDAARSADEIQQDIEKMNDQLKSMNRSIRFTVDDESHDIVVKVVDKNTGEVVMEIPPEEVLKLRERMSEMSGLLVEKQM